MDTPEPLMCQCGCGEPIEPKLHHRYRGLPRFKLGHHSRSPDIPTGRRRSDDIDPPNPSGLCMCGCGEQTPIATSSSRSRQQLIGHPVRYVRGHHSASRARPTAAEPKTPIGRSGERSPRWKGGRTTHRGYVLIYAPDHPSANAKNYVYEHRLVVEEMLGRPLLPDESVHHKNGVKDDNRPVNLELWTRSHPSGQRVGDQLAWAREIVERYGNLPEEAYS